MNLHILFCPAQAIAADGSPLPTASLSLTLPDEVQYRCAGYLQAEIERYAEEIDAAAPAPDVENQEDSSDQDENVPSLDQTKKGRKQPDISAGSSRLRRWIIRFSLLPASAVTRVRLEQEYLFLEVVATFLRAVRAGAVHVLHSAVLLAHYGRLGSSFDGCSKVIVDVLREEGIHNKNSELVIAIVTRAIREVPFFSSPHIQFL